MYQKKGHEKDLNEAQGGTRGFDAEQANRELDERIAKQQEKESEGSGSSS